MKKVLFFALAAAAITFTGCKNEPAAPAPEEEAPEVEVISVDSLSAAIEAGDTTAIGNLFTEVQSKIEELKAIDPSKAQEYLATVQAFLKENAEKIKGVVGTGTVASLIDTVTNLPEIEIPNVGEAAAEAVEGVKEDISNAVDEKVDAAKDAVNEKVDAAKEKVDAAKDAVDEKVEAAKEAADAAKGAADAAKGAADAAGKLLKR